MLSFAHLVSNTIINLNGLFLQGQSEFISFQYVEDGINLKFLKPIKFLIGIQWEELV